MVLIFYIFAIDIDFIAAFCCKSGSFPLSFTGKCRDSENSAVLFLSILFDENRLMAGKIGVFCAFFIVKRLKRTAVFRAKFVKFMFLIVFSACRSSRADLVGAFSF